MAQQAPAKSTFTFDERIDDEARDYIRSRNDAFASALPLTGHFHWAFVEETTGRRHYQLRRNSAPAACYVELTLDEMQALEDSEIDKIIKHNERPCIDVNARLDRWIERLNDLYADVKQWCETGLLGCQIERGIISRHQEPMMRLRRAAPRDIPTLTILYQGMSTRFVPRALFVIGANGIIDVFGPKKHFSLFDLAPDSAPIRDWKITHYSDKILSPFTQPVLTLVVKGRG